MWFDSRCFENSSWKFVVKKSIVDLENYTSDLPNLPIWLCNGLIGPLLRKGTIEVKDLTWFNEEDKDDLFDVTGQYKVAALLIADSKKDKSADQIKQAWAMHKPAFEVLSGILQDDEKTELKENFFGDNMEKSDRALVLNVLGLE